MSGMLDRITVTVVVQVEINGHIERGQACEQTRRQMQARIAAVVVTDAIDARGAFIGELANDCGVGL